MFIHYFGNMQSLSRDYAGISGLMVQLDEQVGEFTCNMDQLNDGAPKHAGLAVLWEEKTRAMQTDLRLKMDVSTGNLEKKQAAPRR